MATSIEGTKTHLVPTGTRSCISLGALLYIILNTACLAAQPAQRPFHPRGDSGFVSHSDLVGRFAADYSVLAFPHARCSRQIFALIWDPAFLQSPWAIGLDCLLI